MYQEARERYAAWGVDTDAAIARLKEIPVSIHCWQGDDVTGLENAGEALSGGIQTTGNYPGKARTFEESTADFDKACSLIPGKKRLNLHASYAVMTDTNRADRDELRPEHFRPLGGLCEKARAGAGFQSHVFQPSHGKERSDPVLALTRTCAGSGSVTALHADASPRISPRN